MKTKSSQTFKQILALLKAYRLKFVISTLLSLLCAALTLAVPILFGQAIDLIIDKGNVNFNGIFKIIMLIAGSVGITAAMQWFVNVLNNHMAYSIVSDMRQKAFNKLQKMPLSYIDSHQYGDTVSRIITDVETFADGLLLGFSQLFNGIITILGTLILMLSINWKIALIVVILTPISLFAAKFIADRTHSMFIKQSETRGEQTSFVEEIVGNQKVVKAFNHEQKSIEKFDEINKKLYKASLKATFFSSMVNPTTRIINSIAYALVCLVGAFSVISNPAFTVGALSALLSYAGQYAKPFNEISGVVTELQNAFACAGRVFELTSTKEESSDKKLKNLKSVEGNVEIKNVGFSYTSKKPLIENLNLNVKKGQRVAIVGPTGCGKTTVINLLMRFYDVTSGNIKIDENDIKKITRKSLRKNYGMVLQETWLKSGTIKENITMGNPTATDEEIIAAAKSTHAHSFIKRLPNGYDTVITEDGGNLSEGQKQLLCITRVLLCTPPMLILDEATSSIDVRTELHIRHTFDRMMQGRTSFIVAHRLSTIKDADIILVMKDGNIIEQGNHEELIAKKGFYYELYNSQFEK